MSSSVLVGILLLVAGALILILSKYRRSKYRGRIGVSSLLVIVVAGAAVTFGPGPEARAATSDCVTPDNSLTITQTSTMDDLAPGLAAVPIAGTVLNLGPDDTYITAIAVEIVSITKNPAAVAGTCAPDDYILRNTRMPVQKALSPGASVRFIGASIGFNNKSSNQDGCKNAIIHLRYRTTT